MKQTIFSAINRVVNTVYKKDKIEDLPDSKDITFLMETLHVEKEEAIIFAYFVYRKIEEGVSYFTIEDIGRDINVSYTESLGYIPYIESLLKKGYFCLRDKIKLTKNFKVDRYTDFTIDEDFIDLLTYNQPIENYKPVYNIKEYNAVDFISSLSMEKPYTLKSKLHLKKFISPYLKDPWVEKLVKNLTLPAGSNPDPIHVLVNGDTNLTYFCIFASMLWDEKSVSIKDGMSNINETTHATINLINQVKAGTHPLVKYGYFELDKTDIADNASFIWGPEVLKAFEGYEDLLMRDTAGKELQKIEFKDIKSKNLYYNESNEKDIERLENIMKEENYIQLRKRLDEKSLPKGLTVLLYGAPGTGKTETVMQLAKKTGRDVYHLNIEQIKSCWVGESEKNIKAIFKAYYASKAKIKPILLFNEADAIISKRTSVDGNNAAVVKMENAIQNLLLEELEKFDGIFIATTNRANDIDAAFDRRLLFKLKFENPNVPVKAKIWKDRLDWLNDSEANRLAQNYDLSGGQIDNIYRKSEIDYLLYGKKPTVDELLDFCKKEKLENEGSSRIGFFN